MSEQQEKNQASTQVNREVVKTHSSDGFAVTSLVTGILTIVLFWLWPLALILGVLALTFGIISYHKRKNGMALAGAICGGVGLLFMLLFVIFVVAVAHEVTTNYPSYY